MGCPQGILSQNGDIRMALGGDKGSNFWGIHVRREFEAHRTEPIGDLGE
jgi:hypothetical protein